MKKISFIIACYNEEDNIPLIYSAISKIMADMPQYNYNFTFADNASTDRSREVLRNLAAKDKRVRVILNNRNFGPARSGFNGFISTDGDATINLACDMQNPPELIPVFLKHWEAGSKVVWAQKTNSEESFLMKQIRNLYYKIIKLLSDVNHYENAIGWGLYDKSIVDEVRSLKDPEPDIRDIVSDFGYEVTLVPYVHPARRKGKSSYNFFRYFDAALSSLVHTSKVPLKLCIFLGLGMSFLSGLVSLFYLVYKLMYWNSFQLGLAPLVCGIFFIFSVQIFFLGILGEYVLSILGRVSFNKYVIEKERINFED
ncbi:MAG: glycosyltransferase family 2 protein [Endomicrobium sp.]|jgi:glycosyltransferase involved in cell wall biosynthesis|nr:glycosyltransferase family 2 protein [Endomicrobium sp.]